MTENAEADLMLEQGYLPSRTVANVIGCNITTVYRRCKRGDWMGKKVAGYWYVRVKSLLKYYYNVPEIRDNFTEISGIEWDGEKADED